MSERWPGGIISGTAPVPSGSFANSTAPGVWTMEQAAYWQAQGNWPIAGNFQNYIEDVFSTFLYTGTGATQTINNGIDLSGKGGLVWAKSRSNAYDNNLVDTVRGNTKLIFSNTTNPNFTSTDSLTSFNSNGFTLGADTSSGGFNNNTFTYVTWTFREQAKFFDVVTYTGNGTSGRTVSHSLGSAPGCIIVKSTSQASDWFVYHRSLGNTKVGFLNTTAAPVTASSAWNNTSPTSTEFTVGNSGDVNDSGQTYVAYLFAHDAGGFGLSGNENVISCGSYTANGNNTINLGYEPQWILEKRVSSSGDDWEITDNMRGFSMTGFRVLAPNTNAAEVSYGAFRQPTATGYINKYWGSGTIIYMAIRRGPMKVPTTGTSVFTPLARTGTSTSNTAVTAGFPVDAAFIKASSTDKPWDVEDRLRGGGKYMSFNDTYAEVAGSPTATMNFTASNTGLLLGTDSWVNSSANSYANYFLRRAPGFFDEVCYTGTGSNTTQAHNLTVAPELMIVKSRSASANWTVYSSATGNTNALLLNDTTGSFAAATTWNNTTPTSSVFSIGTSSAVNTSTATYVAYLFATCAGVSKVGSYTGNGTTQAIACGFTGGARFVLIKRTDATGGWYVYDTARGMTTLTDPYLFANTDAAQTATLGSVTTTTGGFTVDATILAAINTNAASYIFLAIA